MSTLIVVGFKKDKFRAAEVLDELMDRGYDWTMDLEDAVATYRDYNGKLRIDASYQMTTAEGAALGGLFGSLIGLTLGVIAAPVTAGVSAATAGVIAAGALGGSALGAGVGALDAKWWKNDFGISDQFVQDVGALVQPGDSALYALLRTADPAFAVAKFSDYGGVVLSTKLSPEQAKTLQDILRGKNNSKLAGTGPQADKEEPMGTWTELEKQIEPQLRAWAQAMDEIEAEEDAKEAELDAKIEAAQADAQARLQAQAAKLNAGFEAQRARLQQEMNALNDKINAAVEHLDAETDKAVGTTKADLEAQQARMRTDREKLNAQIKSSYQAQVKHVRNQITQMQVWAQTRDAEVRAKINTQLEVLRQQVAKVEQHIRNLHAEQVATWNENMTKVDRAMADLKQAREKAMADLDQGYDKAKAEFKKPA